MSLNYYSDYLYLCLLIDNKVIETEVQRFIDKANLNCYVS